MEVESTASQQTQYAKKHGKGSRASKEGDRQANQTGEHAGHRKKDKVEISDEGRLAASLVSMPTAEKFSEQKRGNIHAPNCIEAAIDVYIHNAVVGKVDPYMLGGLRDMLLSSDPSSSLETRAADREAGKDIAKYIVENYFDDPEEAQAFMNMINKIAELSEARDKGYVISSRSFIDTDDKDKQWSELSDEEKISYISSLILDIEPAMPAWSRVLWEDTSYSSEKYAEFSEKEQAVQSIIDNAKLTTDFSGNEKWNSVMKSLNGTILDGFIPANSAISYLGQEASSVLQKLRAEQEQRRQLWAEEINNDDFVEKLARGDYGTQFKNGYCTTKADYEFLMANLSEEQRIELGQLVRVEYNMLSPQTSDATNFIFDALNEKMETEEAKQVAQELGRMITNAPRTFFNAFTGVEVEDLETKAANREAGRDLAKYIADNYFDNPEEAKAFMDKINKYIETSELLDKGYEYRGDDGQLYKPIPSEFELWLKKNEYAESFLDARKEYSEYELGELMNKYIKEYNVEPIRATAFEIWLKDNGYANSLQNAYGKYGTNGIEKLYQDVYRKEVKDEWDEIRLFNCHPSNILIEENKAWYAEFDAKVNLAQSIIDNAKQITDFSGNEKWKSVINLLTKAA